MPGADLEIVSLAPSWLTGIELTGVSLTLPAEEEGERPSQVSLPHVSARVGLFDSLFGMTSASFSAELGSGGTIEGSFSDSGTETQIRMHLSEIALARIGPLRRYTMLPVSGTLSGDVDLVIADQAENTHGQITLTIAQLSVGDGRARLAIPGMGNGVTVEQLNAGDLNLRMEIERGAGRIQEFTASGDDIDIRGAGTVRFLRPIRMSGVDVMLRLEVKPPYRERNDRTRAVFSMLDLSPQVRPYRAPDGAIQLRLSGSLGSSVRASAAGTATLPR